MCIINSVALLDYPYYSYYDFNIITGVVLHLPERERESECVCLLCMHAYIHIIHANGDECTINQAESEAAAKVFLPEAMPRWLVERYHSPEVRSLRIRSPGTNAKRFLLCSIITPVITATLAAKPWMYVMLYVMIFVCGVYPPKGSSLYRRCTADFVAGMWRLLLSYNVMLICTIPILWIPLRTEDGFSGGVWRFCFCGCVNYARAVPLYYVL